VPLLTIILIITVDLGSSGLNNDGCQSCLKKYPSYQVEYKGTQITGSGNMILAYSLSIYIVVAIYSTVFAFRRLKRPGVSNGVRSMFLKKHLYYVIVFTVIWTLQLS
jgi:hypothetical protein